MQNSKPVVSIITTCYNSESYLPRYLDSILSQSYKNIQQIIVNDGSFDNTEKIIYDYIPKFESAGMEITYFKQENKGLGAAVNTGLKYIKGKYFTWCDSDNFLSPDYVESKVSFLENNPEYSIVRCNGYVVDESNITLPIGIMDGNSIIDKTNENLFLNCLFVTDFHFGCAMVKTADFDKVVKDREIFPSKYGHNWQLLLPMFYHYKSGYVDKPMFYFVVRSDSLSNSVEHENYQKKIDMYEGHYEIIEKTLLNMNVPDSEKYLKKVRAKHYHLELSVLFGAKDKKQFKRIYKSLKKLEKISEGTKDSYYELCYPLLYKVYQKIIKTRK